MNHKYYKREDKLLHCKICLGAEASLPRDCPGTPMSDSRQDEVKRGEINFFADRGWVYSDEPQEPDQTP